MSAKRLKEIMEKLGLKKSELAEQIGVSVRTVEGWLAGRSPSRVTIRVLEGMVRRKAA